MSEIATQKASLSSTLMKFGEVICDRSKFEVTPENARDDELIKTRLPVPGVRR